MLLMKYNLSDKNSNTYSVKYKKNIKYDIELI